MKQVITKWAACLCMLVLAVGVMAGCAQNNQMNSEQQANRTYMSQVNEIIDQLNGDLDSFVQGYYTDGTKKMRDALDAYINLYTELEAGSFDQSTYSKRIADVQKLYDEGVETLKKGDEAAAAKQ